MGTRTLGGPAGTAAAGGGGAAAGQVQDCWRWRRRWRCRGVLSVPVPGAPGSARGGSGAVPHLPHGSRVGGETAVRHGATSGEDEGHGDGVREYIAVHVSAAATGARDSGNMGGLRGGFRRYSWRESLRLPGHARMKWEGKRGMATNGILGREGGRVVVGSTRSSLI